MQDLVSCDYFRTPVIFQVPDIYRFVGGSASYTLRARSPPQNPSTGKVPGINGAGAWITPMIIDLITSFQEGRQTPKVHLEEKYSTLTTVQ